MSVFGLSLGENLAINEDEYSIFVEPLYFASKLTIERINDMKDQLSQQLALLNQNDKMLNDLYHNYAVSINLSDTAFWIIYITWTQGDGCTQKELCELWSYSRQTINTALKSLEKKGYIKLVPMLGNRKSKQLFFTDTGKEFAQKIIPPMLEAESVSFGQLSEQERADLTFLSIKRTKLLQKEIAKSIASITEKK